MRLLRAAILVVGLVAATEIRAETASQQREAAVLHARAGHMAEAQRTLRGLLAAGIDDGLVAIDLATLLQQDGKPAEAVQVFETAARADPPSYGLLAATRAYRDLGRYGEAERLARQGMQRFAAEPVWPLLLSLVLSDQKRTPEALAVLREPAAQRAPPAQRLLAEAYAWRRAGQPAKALSVYEQAIAASGNDRAVRAEAASLLQELGAPYGAAMIAGRVTPDIAADQAAAQVRWGAEIRPPAEPQRRFEGTDSALARIEREMAALPPGAPAAAGVRRRLRLERVMALRDRVRMQEAADEAAALAAEGPLPARVEQAWGDALLYLRRPEEARAAYRRVLAESPKDVAARYGLLYASVDLEDFTTAYATIDGLLADEPVWRTYRGDPTLHLNQDRSYVEVTAAQVRYYGNQLGEAWARITRLTAAAPAYYQGRLAQYQIASARGWPRRASEEGEIAASLAPLEVSARIARIEIAMMNYRYAEAQRLLAELQALYPEDQAVRRLARELDAKRRFVLELEVKPGTSEGGGSNASGRTIESTGHLYSPPIADNWRLFALGGYANAHPAEGLVERGRAGAGVEWRNPALTATLYPTQSWGTLNRAGGGATLDWAASDEVHVALAAELFSVDTPLRALFYGITADSYGGRLAYRWHEGRSLAAGFGYLPFTDGNQRLTASLTYKEMLVALPGFSLTGRAEAYGSRNTSTLAPYYNPLRDLSLTAGLSAEHTLWRRYDNGLVQVLDVDGGLYAEHGFAEDWIGTVSYTHRWRFDPLTELRYGVVLTRRVYDGAVENGLALVIGLSQRI